MRALANTVCVLAGLVVALTASFSFVAEPELPVVDPRSMQVASSLEDVPGSWLQVTVLVAAALIACAGLPRGRRSDRGRSGVGQGLAALLVVVGVVLASILTSLWYVGPEAPCRYSSCWPAEAQALAIAVPGLLAAAALTVAALLGNRLSWLLGALAPAAVWLGSVLLLRLLWQPWLLPIFLSPPS